MRPWSERMFQRRRHRASTLGIEPSSLAAPNSSRSAAAARAPVCLQRRDSPAREPRPVPNPLTDCMACGLLAGRTPAPSPLAQTAPLRTGRSQPRPDPRRGVQASQWWAARGSTSPARAAPTAPRRGAPRQHASSPVRITGPSAAGARKRGAGARAAHCRPLQPAWPAARAVASGCVRVRPALHPSGTEFVARHACGPRPL
jgi:hypothetical protein